LEEIVNRLDAGQIKLDEALKLFEEGIGLSRQCSNQLAVAQQKVEKLMEKDGEMTTEPVTMD
jgi:exodeoxyribonuclease VII small subunit